VLHDYTPEGAEEQRKVKPGGLQRESRWEKTENLRGFAGGTQDGRGSASDVAAVR